MIQNYAKQISSLKTKLTEQGVQLLLNKEEPSMQNSYPKNRIVQKLGVIKRPSLNPKNLAPLKDSRSASRNGVLEVNQTFENVDKSN